MEKKKKLDLAFFGDRIKPSEKTDYYCSKFGGKPDWPLASLKDFEKTIKCENCEGEMYLIFQIYSATEKIENRTLYFFGCNNCEKSDFKFYRLQVDQVDEELILNWEAPIEGDEEENEEISHSIENWTINQQNDTEIEENPIKNESTINTNKQKDKKQENLENPFLPKNNSFNTFNESQNDNPFLPKSNLFSGNTEKEKQIISSENLENPFLPKNNSFNTFNESQKDNPFLPKSQSGFDGNEKEEETFSFEIKKQFPSKKKKNKKSRNKKKEPSDCLDAFWMDWKEESMSDENDSKNEELKKYEKMSKKYSKEGGWDNESYESSFSDEKGKMFQKFTKIIKQDPSQVIRFSRFGEPLWMSHSVPKQIPLCPNCGSRRIFEVQIISSFIYLIGKNKGFRNFGVIAFYTCSSDCSPKDNSHPLLQEYFYLQDCPF